MTLRKLKELVEFGYNKYLAEADGTEMLIVHFGSFGMKEIPADLMKRAIEDVQKHLVCVKAETAEPSVAISLLMMILQDSW